MAERDSELVGTESSPRSSRATPTVSVL